MTIKYHRELIQGSDEWIAVRRGKLTASEMHLIITPKLKVADNDKSRSHMFELLAQRISGYVEPHYVSDDMIRGHQDELDARELYHAKIARVEEVGFITNDRWGFTIGYSPDALVGDNGLIECKGRRQKIQVATIVTGEIPAENVIQCQTGLLVSERKWCDYISYSNGLPMYILRTYPDATIQEAIVAAASAFEAKLKECHAEYLEKSKVLIPTARRIIQEMHI